MVPRRRRTAGPGAPAAAAAAPDGRRSSVGVEREDLRGTVSLNWRTLAKPAAKATWATGRSVVSTSTRAVWARWARARASAPVPTSATSSRWSWRSL